MAAVGAAAQHREQTQSVDILSILGVPPAAASAVPVKANSAALAAPPIAAVPTPNRKRHKLKETSALALREPPAAETEEQPAPWELPRGDGVGITSSYRGKLRAGGQQALQRALVQGFVPTGAEAGQRAPAAAAPGYFSRATPPSYTPPPSYAPSLPIASRCDQPCAWPEPLAGSGLPLSIASNLATDVVHPGNQNPASALSVMPSCPAMSPLSLSSCDLSPMVPAPMSSGSISDEQSPTVSVETSMESMAGALMAIAMPASAGFGLLSNEDLAELLRTTASVNSFYED